MSFELSPDNDHQLAAERVLDHPVLTCNCFALFSFKEAGAQDLYIAIALNENAVALDELLVPQKQVVPVVVHNRAHRAFERPTHDPNNLVDGQVIAATVPGLNDLAFAHRSDPLSDVRRLHIHKLALLIDNLEVVFMHLQHEADVFITVEIDEVFSLKALLLIERGYKVGVCLRFQLEVVGVYFDLLLGHVQHNRDAAAFHVDDLPRLPFVLGLNDPHHISRLEILADHADLHSKGLSQLRDADSSERYMAVLDAYYLAFDSREISFVNLNLVPLSVNGSAALHQCIFQHIVEFFIIAAVVLEPGLFLGDQKVLNFFVVRFDVCAGVNLFEGKRLEQEPLVEKVVVPDSHVLLQLLVLYLPYVAKLVGGPEVEFLGHFGESSGFVLFADIAQVDSRDQADPDLHIGHHLDQRDVPVVAACIFDAHPLKVLQI